MSLYRRDFMTFKNAMEIGKTEQKNPKILRGTFLSNSSDLSWLKLEKIQIPESLKLSLRAIEISTEFVDRSNLCKYTITNILIKLF